MLKDGGKIDIVRTNGRLTVRGPYANRIKFIGNKMFEYGEPDEFYLNDGSGTAWRVRWLGDESNASYGVAAGDLTGDGFPEIGSANSGSVNRLFMNRGRR